MPSIIKIDPKTFPKQLYSFSLGIIFSLSGVWLWNFFNPPTQTKEIQTKEISSQPVIRAVIRGVKKGNLRFGNRTNRAVRLVLSSPNSAEPLHWDFEPGEGSEGGLLLSLPNQKPQVQPGDLIFIFATDGSRNYWSQMVMDQVNPKSEQVLSWNSDRQEWQMILKP